MRPQVAARVLVTRRNLQRSDKTDTTQTQTPTQTAIVTGASSGIGLALTRALLDNGYRVVANARHASTAGTLKPSRNLVLVDGDVADPDTAASLTRTAVERFGSVDLLVNNAGVFIAKPFTDYTVEDFQRLVATNLTGFFHVTQAAVAPDAVPGLRARRHDLDHARESTGSGRSRLSRDPHQGRAQRHHPRAGDRVREGRRSRQRRRAGHCRYADALRPSRTDSCRRCTRSSAWRPSTRSWTPSCI